MRINCLILAGLFAAPYLPALSVGTPAYADAIQDANRLLQVTDAGKQFNSTALEQTQNILRTYSSIVSMWAETKLPQQVKLSIAACYEEAYAWENFESGIAGILAQNLTVKEMRLLIDFNRNLGLPPNQIPTFKTAIAKSRKIQQMTAEYIYANSDGCVDRDAELILGYLYDQRRQENTLAAE